MTVSSLNDPAPRTEIGSGRHAAESPVRGVVTHRLNDALSGLPAIAVLRGITPDEAIAIGDVLVACGFRVIEVPLTSPFAMQSIAVLARHLGPHVLVGAGMVDQEHQLDELLEAGGAFMATANLQEGFIAASSLSGLVTIAEVTTPGEAMTAINAGADGLKVLLPPTNSPETIAVLRDTVGQRIPLIPASCIRPDNIVRYLDAGASAFIAEGPLYLPLDSATQVKKMARKLVTYLISAHA